MCGRFTLSTPGQIVADTFGLPNEPHVEPRYNIAPTQGIVTIRQLKDGTRALHSLHWGLIPEWARDPSISTRMINARAETLIQRSAFRDSFRLRRCLIPADGFFEWQGLGDMKQPHLIRMPDRRLFAFAGLWTRWRPRQLRPVGVPAIESCTIITTEPNPTIASLHNRMPVILAPDAYKRWLDPELQEPNEMLDFLRPWPGELITQPVSRSVNNVRNDGPECIQPLVAEHPSAPRLFD